MMESSKLDTQASVESNEINNEITKLTSSIAAQNTNNNTTTATTTNGAALNEETPNQTPTPISFGTPSDTFVYFSTTSKSITSITSKPYQNGKIRKAGANYVFKQENIKSYTDTHGIVYNVNDHVYMDINKPNEPFAIACVLDFKLTKRDNVVIQVKCYYRSNELPDGVYMPLIQDRISENDISSELYEPIIKGRELFASDSRDIYPATFIKGKCRVFHFEDIIEAKNFKPFADTFFCILTYNPEARRLANTQGEIRVGASHQVKLPAYASARDHKELNASLRKWEHCTWKCKSIRDSHLYEYVQAARSLAAFAGMCDRGSVDDMYEAAQSDATSLHAMNVLHECAYDTEKALKLLVKTNHTAKLLEKKWNEEDQKKFVKGLTQFGKNFFRIRKELLPHKDTTQIVEFYYLWKKTPSAQQNRFRRRLRPSSAKKFTQTNPKKSSSSSNSNGNANNNSNTANTNTEQFSGGSDIDSDNDSDESSEQKQAAVSSQSKCCSNCLTSATTDLQNGGRDSQLLCYDCRMFYKKYGELPKIGNDKTAPTSNKLECNLLKRITEEDEFNKSCDTECADTIAKDLKEVTNLDSKTLTPSQLDETSPAKSESTTKTESPLKLSSMSSASSSSSSSMEDEPPPNCVSPDPPHDQLVDDYVPKPINFVFNKPIESIKPESNAMFARVWDRGTNTCTRTDVQFRYLPNSKYIRERALKKETAINNNKSNTNHVNTTNSIGNSQAPLNQVPPFQPGLPPNFNFNFKDMIPNTDELHMMNKLLLPPPPPPPTMPQPSPNPQPSQQPPQFNQLFNNFMFNQPKPTRPPPPPPGLDPQQQQFLQQMEQMAKQMNMNPAFHHSPIPPHFLNSSNPSNPLLNDLKQAAVAAAAAAAAAGGANNNLPAGLPKFPYEFDLNPALRQLRDIADKSNLINSFSGLNNNPMFNFQQ